jgi:hypothetical protein
MIYRVYEKSFHNAATKYSINYKKEGIQAKIYFVYKIYSKSQNSSKIVFFSRIDFKLNPRKTTSLKLVWNLFWHFLENGVPLTNYTSIDREFNPDYVPPH